MNNHRLLFPGPAQRAASEISTTMNGLADGVREMSASLDELRAGAKTPVEPSPPVEQEKADKTSLAELKSETPPQPEETLRYLSKETSAPEQPLPAEEPENLTSPPNGTTRPEVHEPVEQRKAVFPWPEIGNPAAPVPAASSAAHPQIPAASPASSPSLFTLPPVPDLRPQLEAFVNTVVRNQQLMIGLLQSSQQVLNAHATQISELKKQIAWQQNVMSNQRRF
jgi:hypothetical protein